MSKRTYIRVAAVIHTALDVYPESAPALRNTAHGMAIMFEQENTAFDRERFMDACGFGDVEAIVELLNTSPWDAAA